MDILFWSGGKDAYLAYEFYRQKHPKSELKLLTTYSENSEIVPHQKIPIEIIKEQAKALKLELILVPLPEDCPNDIYLEKIKDALENEPEKVNHLIFGDWHLEDIRNWRESQFEKLGYSCLFPIWQKKLDELLPVLLFKPVEIRINAVQSKYEKFIRVGELFNKQFIRQLPKEIDPMGEKGEFHTKVIFKNWDDEHQPKRQPIL